MRTDRRLRVWLMVLGMALVSAPVFAQSASTSQITGVVTDSGGGVIPGATVTAKADATNGTSTAVTASNGTFTIPGLIPGKYTVTVALQGFKTAVLKDVQRQRRRARRTSTRRSKSAASARPSSSKARPQVIQTQSSAAASTITTNQIANLPRRQPQRARLRDVPAGRADAGRQPRLASSTACRRARSTSRSTA